MKFHTTRWYYPHGVEGEDMEITNKEFDDIEKAIKYAHRYNKGTRFAGIEIEDEEGNMVYEITSNGDIFDHRNKVKNSNINISKTDYYYFIELMVQNICKRKEQIEDIQKIIPDMELQSDKTRLQGFINGYRMEQKQSFSTLQRLNKANSGKLFSKEYEDKLKEYLI